MKTIYIKLRLLSLCLLMLFACKKDAPLEDLNPPKVAKLQLQGLVLTDTLEFVLDGTVIGQAIDNTFTIEDRLYSAGKEIEVRKKSDKKRMGKITVAESPYNQVKKIFYDGNTFTDRIELTPVNDTNNMGIRLRFTTTFADFYGGPVDIEILEWARTVARPRVTTVTPIKIIPNITGDFGEFIELPPLVEDPLFAKSYAIRVYKAGTKELPYKSLTNVNVDPTLDYATFIFTPGDSQLLSISPLQGDFNGTFSIIEGYEIKDFSYSFK